MSWQSTPSGERWIERDDEPEPATMPAQVRCGETFARQDRPPHGDWDLYYWVPSCCSRCGGTGRQGEGEECPHCQGRGFRPDDREPELYVSGLMESDARTLVYAPEALRLASLLAADVNALASVVALPEGMRQTLRKLEAKLAEVKGA